MDSEDICLSVFLCICVGEGIGDKSKSIYPLVFTDEGIGDKSKSIYPLVFTDEGIGDKSKSIYPLVFINYYPCQGQSALSMPNFNVTYQDYASDIREILAYKQTQHKDIMSELNVQFFMADGTIQIKK